jgi:hypothetical protein
MLSDQWTAHDFYPLDYLPTAGAADCVRRGDADLPPQVRQDFLDAVAAGTAAVPIGRCTDSARSCRCTLTWSRTGPVASSSSRHEMASAGRRSE